MEINGYVLSPEIESLMQSRGIKNSDIEMITSSPKAAYFYNADKSFGIVKCYAGINTYYLEYEQIDGKKAVTDAYCHWVALVSDM